MPRHSAPSHDGFREELLRLYAEADTLMAGSSCTCTDAADAAGAYCCHFANIGREPYVTEVEVVLVARAVAERGGFPAIAKREPRRRLPLAADLGTCPLLSPTGRCTIYASRPLGCRTFFCEGHGPPMRGNTRKRLLELARRVADLSDRAFPRAGGPRPLRRAVASLVGHTAR